MATIFGFYWPGKSKFINSIYFLFFLGVEQFLSTANQWLIYIYSLIIVILPIIQLTATAISLILYPVPLSVIILIIRRCIAMMPLLLRLISHILPTRRRTLTRLFDQWNNEINTGANKLERQV